MSKKQNLTTSDTEQPILSDEQFTLKNYHGLDYDKPENRDEFNAITKHNNEVKKQALDFIKNVLVAEKLADKYPRLSFAIATAFRVRAKGTGKPTEKKSSVISALFANIGDSFSEIDVYGQIKLGRSDMKRAIANLITNEGKYIAFTDEKTGEPVTTAQQSGEYTLVAIGEAPKDWKGYVPKEKKEPVEITDEESIMEDNSGDKIE